jgi:hypothetical protein
VSHTGDDDLDMSALRFLDDDAIEAVTVGDDVVAELATLASFAAQVRSLGDEPAPRPSLELQALIAAHAREVGKADRARRVTPPSLGVDGLLAPGRAAQRRLASVAGRVTGLGIAARVALGVSVATAGVAGAGVAGALPDRANRAVRDAIEVVTPLELPGRDPGVADVGPRARPTTTVAPDARASSTGPSPVDGTPSTDAPATTPDDPRSSPSRHDGDGRESWGDGDPDRDERRDGTPEYRYDPGRYDGDRDRDRYSDDDHDRDADVDGDSDSDYFRYRGQRWDDPGATSDETTPATAPGDTPDAAGDEGTGQWPAPDADAATPTG